MFNCHELLIITEGVGTEAKFYFTERGKKKEKYLEPCLYLLIFFFFSRTHKPQWGEGRGLLFYRYRRRGGAHL